MQLELGQVTPAQFRDGIRHLTQEPLTDEQIDAAWIAMLDDIPTYKLDLLLELRKSYNTMLLSNTNEIHWEWAKNHGFNYAGHTVDDFFNKIYLSYELHMLKPNADIFEYVLQDAGIRPEETLFIDDALPNCKMAEQLGIHTYVAQPREDWSGIFISPKIYAGRRNLHNADSSPDQRCRRCDSGSRLAKHFSDSSDNPYHLNSGSCRH